MGHDACIFNVGPELELTPTRTHSCETVGSVPGEVSLRLRERRDRDARGRTDSI
jgi:hypothetical protein